MFPEHMKNFFENGKQPNRKTGNQQAQIKEVEKTQTVPGTWEVLKQYLLNE